MSASAKFNIRLEHNEVHVGDIEKTIEIGFDPSKVDFYLGLDEMGKLSKKLTVFDLQNEQFVINYVLSIENKGNDHNTVAHFYGLINETTKYHDFVKYGSNWERLIKVHGNSRR